MFTNVVVVLLFKNSFEGYCGGMLMATADEQGLVHLFNIERPLQRGSEGGEYQKIQKHTRRGLESGMLSPIQLLQAYHALTALYE